MDAEQLKCLSETTRGCIALMHALQDKGEFIVAQRALESAGLDLGFIKRAQHAIAQCESIDPVKNPFGFASAYRNRTGCTPKEAGEATRAAVAKATGATS